MRHEYARSKGLERTLSLIVLAVLLLAPLMGCGGNPEVEEPCAAESECASSDDTTPPEMSITSAGQASSPAYTLQGRIEDDSSISKLEYSLNDEAPEPLSLENGTFEAELTLQVGDNHIVLTAVDAAGNDGRAEIHVDLDLARESLVADFSYSGSTRVGQPVVFDASASSIPTDEEVTFDWQFGDGSTGRATKLVHLFDEPGTYVIELTVQTGSGETSVHLDNITIDEVDSSHDSSGRIEGHVVDTDNRPVPDVTVARAGDARALTDGLGHFIVTQVPTGGSAQLTFRKTGYVVQSMRISVPQSSGSVYVKVTLRDAHTQVHDLNDGPEFVAEGTDGASVEGTQSDLASENPTGELTIEITVVDPTSAPDQMPMPSTGWDASGQPVSLASVGAVHVAFFLDGEPVQLSRGAQVMLSIPDFVGAASAGDELALWSLAVGTSEWVEEGSATAIANDDSPTGIAARTQVNHAGWWLLAAPVEQSFDIRPSCTVEGDGVTPEPLEDGEACSVQLVTEDSPGWSEVIVVESDQASVTAPVGTVCASASARGGTCAASRCVTGSAGEQLDVELVLNCMGSASEELAQEQFVETSQISPGGLKRYWFDASEKEGFILQVVPVAMSGEVVFRSDTGLELARSSFGTMSGGHFGFIAPVAGTYFVEIDNHDSSEGQATIRLRSVRSIEIGETVRGELDEYEEHQFLFYSSDAQAFVNAAHTGRAGIGVDVTGLDESSEGYEGREQAVWGESGVVALPEAGYHLITIDNGADSPGRPYELHLAEVSSPSTLTFGSDNRAESNGRFTSFGQRFFFSFQMSEGDGYLVQLKSRGNNVIDAAQEARFRLWQLDDGEFYGSRRFGPGAKLLSEPRTFQPGTQMLSTALDAKAGTAPATDTYIVEVVLPAAYAGGVELGGFEVIVDRAPAASQIVVDDDAACAGASTRSFNAAIHGVSPGGTVTVCDGEYQENVPAVLAVPDVTVEGNGRATTLLRRTVPSIGPDGFEDLTGLTIAASGVTVQDMGIALVSNSGRSTRAIIGDSESYLTLNNIALRRLDLHAVLANKDESTAVLFERTVLSSSTINDLTVAGVVYEGVRLDKATDVTLDELDIEHIYSGFHSLRDAENVQLTNSNLRSTSLDDDLRDPTVWFEGDAVGVTIADNVLRGSIRFWSRYNRERGGIVIEDNEITVQNGDPAIELIQDSDSPSFQSATVRGNQMTKLAGGSVDVVTIELGESPNSVVFEGNEIAREDAAGVALVVEGNTTTAGDVAIRNNVMTGLGSRGIEIKEVDSFTSLEFFNNSFRHLGSQSGTSRTIHLDEGWNSSTTQLNVVFRNNIFHGFDAQRDIAVDIPSGTSVDADYNLFFDYGVPYRAGSVQQSEGLNDLVGQDPLFVNNRLELDASSPAVDAGTNLGAPADDIDGNVRPQGAATDMGAHEQ